MDRIDLLPLPDIKPEPEHEIRLLTADEISTLLPIFESEATELPDPATSFIVGAIDPTDGHIAAFLVTQLRVHAEPMWIEPGHESVFRKLVRATEQTIAERVGVCDVFLFAPAGKISRMAQTAGMRIEPWVVMSKRVVSEQPVDIKALSNGKISDARIGEAVRTLFPESSD